jgi:hypothetical protein
MDDEIDTFVPTPRTVQVRSAYVKIDLGDEVYFTISHRDGQQCEYIFERFIWRDFNRTI